MYPSSWDVCKDADHYWSHRAPPHWHLDHQHWTLTNYVCHIYQGKGRMGPYFQGLAEIEKMLHLIPAWLCNIPEILRILPIAGMYLHLLVLKWLFGTDWWCLPGGIILNTVQNSTNSIFFTSSATASYCAICSTNSIFDPLVLQLHIEAYVAPIAIDYLLLLQLNNGCSVAQMQILTY